MAKLPAQTLTTIFALQRQLVEGIDEAAATEAMIFAQFGETEVTVPILEQLQNIRERLINPYSRLATLLHRIAEYQPNAPADMLNFLYQTIEQASAAHDASAASVREAKMEFNL